MRLHPCAVAWSDKVYKYVVEQVMFAMFPANHARSGQTMKGAMQGIMNRAATVLHIAIFLASCTGNPGTVEEEARLRVTQHQLACCYVEGQVSFLQLVDAAGEIVVDESFRPLDMIFPVLDQHLPAGRYTLRTWQRPCSGNCGSLDPPRNQCESTLALAPGTETFITSAFTPGEGCSHTQTAEPLASTIPDSFVFRETLRSCGEEFPIAGPLRGGNPVRDCFLDAWVTGDRVEATLWARISERTVRPRYHRILPDRRIEVFAAPLNPRNGDSWARYQCTDLTAVDDERVFVLEGCSDPEILAQ